MIQIQIHVITQRCKKYDNFMNYHIFKKYNAGAWDKGSKWGAPHFNGGWKSNFYFQNHPPNFYGGALGVFYHPKTPPLLQVWGGVWPFLPQNTPPKTMGGPPKFSIVGPLPTPHAGAWSKAPALGGRILKITPPHVSFWGVKVGFWLKIHPRIPFWGGIWWFLPFDGPPQKIKGNPIKFQQKWHFVGYIYL
jgi:hypothetical protein